MNISAVRTKSVASTLNEETTTVHVADMPIIYGSLDYWPVEADR